MAHRFRHRRPLTLHPALLGSLVLGWAQLTPLTPTPALAQGQQPAPQQSRAFQPVPEAIATLQQQARATYSRGERQRALALQQEVMAWVRANLPAVHPFRADALAFLGIYLSGLGQRAEALPPTLEAVKILRELAKTNAAFLNDLAMALNNLGISYSELGQRAEALPPALEAVNIRRKLAKTNPAFLPDLAMALNNLGNRYSELGQRAEALPPTLEAVNIRRELVKTNPAFLPDLAMALNNLGIYLRGMGQRVEALPPTQEAVKLYRELAKTNPAFLPDLAMALNNLGVYYSQLGQRVEALPPTQEAVKLYRELAKTNPAFLNDLAGSLNNLGIRYSELGQRAEALPPTLEAVKISRELAKTNPAFLPDLASALNNLGFFYTQQGQSAEAQPPLVEAIKLYTQLVASYPARFQDDLQRTRNNLENLKRQQDLATGQKRAIAPDDRTYLNASDPNTPLRRSVVRLWPTFTGQGPLLGTGFVVRREGDRAWIATARHVVLSPNTNAPPTQLEAELYSGTLPANLLSARLSVVLPTAAQSDANSGDDLILLEVRGLPADITPLPLAGEPPRGSLKVVGHPTESPPWSVLTFPLLKGSREVVVLDGSLNSGASGSPVLDGRGRVVGLVVATKDYGNKQSQALISAYGTSVLESFLRQLVPAGR